MKTGYIVGDCMTIHPITVEETISIFDCAKIMKQKLVGSVLITSKSKLTGILTEQDLVRKALAQGKDSSTTLVSEIMVKKQDIHSIEPEKDIFEALLLMRDFNIRHLPVMEKENLLGFLTIKDILKIQPQLFEIVADKFEIREASRKPHVDFHRTYVCDECKQDSDDLIEIDGNMLCSSCRQEEE